MSSERKLIKEFEVRLSVKCYLPIYVSTAIKDLAEFLDIWEEVHKDDCSIKIKSHKEIKLALEKK